MEPTQSVWYLRGKFVDAGFWEVTAYLGPEHPDGAVVMESIDPQRQFLWRTSASERGLIGVTVNPNAVAGAPRAWFVHVSEPRSSPTATNLVAYSTEHFPAGTIVDRYTFATLGVGNDEQIGAIRWYRDTGLVHQVFVAEKWRRQQVATLLIYIASAFHQSNGWTGRIHADGRRTELGEQLTASLKHPDRIAPWSDIMPDMDPENGPEPESRHE